MGRIIIGYGFIAVYLFIVGYIIKQIFDFVSNYAILL